MKTMRSIQCCECEKECHGDGKDRFLFSGKLNGRFLDSIQVKKTPWPQSDKVDFRRYQLSWRFTEYDSISPEDEDHVEDFANLRAEGNIEGSDTEEELEKYLFQLPHSYREIDFKYLCHTCAGKRGYHHTPCALCDARK
jgi:hypothetical protein